MTVAVSVLTLLVGGVLGAMSSIYASRVQHRQRISANVAETYLEARQELCERLSELANADQGTPLDFAAMKKYRTELIALTYKYFDFYPSQVLRSMLCLYFCLGDRKHRLFTMRGATVSPMNSDEAIEYVSRVSFTKNFEYNGVMAINSKDAVTRELAAVRYQALGVLTVLNSYLTIRDLVDWTRHAQKLGSFVPTDGDKIDELAGVPPPHSSRRGSGRLRRGYHLLLPHARERS